MEDKLLTAVMKAENTEELKKCAWLQREMFLFLMKDSPVTYAQILFPYADERSVFTARELEEKPLFGTHAVFCGVEREMLAFASDAARKAFFDAFSEEAPTVEIKTISREKSSVERFLGRKVMKGALNSGFFAAAIPSQCEHWQIRDAARRFASFVDIAESKSKGAAVGMLGGRLIMETEKDFSKTADKLYRMKTGEKSETRYYK